MKIRLHGTEDECREVAGRLAAIVEARIAPPVPVASTTGTRPSGRRRALPPGGGTR